MNLKFISDWDRWTRFGFGFSVGLALVVVYGAVILVGGLATATNRSLPYLVQRTLAYAAGATLIAVLEEVFFRGVLFRAMIRDWGVCRALTVSSAVYAGLHCVSGTFLSLSRLGPDGWMAPGFELLGCQLWLVHA